MKLYELKRNDQFQILNEDGEPESETLLFDHIDGMYSVVWDKEGNLNHLAAWTDVKKV